MSNQKGRKCMERIARGASKKRINPSGADGQILRCLSCGSFRHLLDVCPDSLENMEKMNSAEQIIKVRSHNDVVVLGGPKLMDEVTRSVFIKEVTAEMKNLKEETVCIKDEIKQIKCDREKNLLEKAK